MRGERRSFIREDHKLSIQECGKLLNTESRRYSEEEIRLIRDFIYQLAEIDYHEFIRRNGLS